MQACLRGGAKNVERVPTVFLCSYDWFSHIVDMNICNFSTDLYPKHDFVFNLHQQLCDELL